MATLEHVVDWKANNPIKMTLNFWVMVAVFQQSMGPRWVLHAAIFLGARNSDLSGKLTGETTSNGPDEDTMLHLTHQTIRVMWLHED